jgi:hypothetical protein
MKFIKSRVVAVVSASLFLIFTTSRNVNAEDHLGITKKDFIISCNKDFSLITKSMFIQKETDKNFTDYGWSTTYKLSSMNTVMMLKESSGYISKVLLTIPTDKPNIVDPSIKSATTILCLVAFPFLSSDGEKKFGEEYSNNTLQGLTEFIITVGGKIFDITMAPGMSVMMTIKPAQSK